MEKQPNKQINKQINKQTNPEIIALIFDYYICRMVEESLKKLKLSFIVDIIRTAPKNENWKNRKGAKICGEFIFKSIIGASHNNIEIYNPIGDKSEYTTAIVYRDYCNNIIKSMVEPGDNIFQMNISDTNLTVKTSAESVKKLYNYFRENAYNIGIELKIFIMKTDFQGSDRPIIIETFPEISSVTNRYLVSSLTDRIHDYPLLVPYHSEIVKITKYNLREVSILLIECNDTNKVISDCAPLQLSFPVYGNNIDFYKDLFKK